MMSLYQGWNQEEMRLPSASLGETSTEITMPSFTPINSNRAPLPFINPLTTLHQGSLADDFRFNATQEKPPVAKGRKRGTAQTNTGRAVSLAKVWEYRDDGDVATQNQGNDFESSFPKRRKTAPIHRTKSVTANAKTSSKIGDEVVDSSQIIEHAKVQHSSQLTTPPDSETKPKGKATASKAKPGNFVPGPFRNPVITKLSMSLNPEYVEQDPLSKPVTIHQGWTSTEDVVKLQCSVSETILDKLAAFKYKSSANTAREGRSSLLSGSAHVEMQEPCAEQAEALRPPSPLVEHEFVASGFDAPEEVHVTSEQSHKQALQQSPLGTHQLHEDDVFFEDAMWNGNGAKEDAFPSSQVHPIDNTNDMLHNPAKDVSSNVTLPQAAPKFHYIASRYQAGVVTGSQHLSGFGEPTSSDDRALIDMAGEVEYTGELSPAEELQAISDHGERCSSDGSYQAETEVLPHTEISYSAMPPVEGTEFVNIPAQLTAPASNEAEIQRRKPLVDVQVERFDVTDVEMNPEDVSRDFELDEFDDDGLDDADLLALASADAVPETQVQPKPIGNLPRELPSNSVPTERSNDFPKSTSNATTHGKAALNSNGTLPEVIVVESDDEYAMDAELEEDLMSLPSNPNGVIESFQAPPSLQYEFGNGPLPGEVYNRSLQYSPPKSRPSSASRGDANVVSDADQASPAQSHGPDLAILASEEDWSFIRSGGGIEGENSKSLSAEQSVATPILAAEPIYFIPLGPRPRKTASRVQPVTQQANTSNIVLDDSHKYEPLMPFARPDFPDLVFDRCPIIGVSAQTFLRVCFRVAEMLREGARAHAMKQDSVIELFARVTFSSREPGTTKQHFQFADLWHDRPPTPNGMLANYKITGLAESECRVFIGAKQPIMARALGRLKRDAKNANGWLLHIFNIRPTDWEEIRWTKRIVSAGAVKSEKVNI